MSDGSIRASESILAHEAPSPHEERGFRLVLEDIGRGDSSLLQTLAHILPLSQRDLARVVFQAPSILASDISQIRAQRMSAILAGIGVHSTVSPMEAPFLPGTGDYEIALKVGDLARIEEVFSLVSALLSVDGATARSMVLATPAVIMGNISEATARALAERFEARGSSLLVSRPEVARYDVFLGSCPKRSVETVLQAAKDSGLDIDRSRLVEGRPFLLASGVARAIVDSFCSRLPRVSIPLRILNRDFELFDILLKAAPETAEADRFLVGHAKLDPKELFRFRRGLPSLLFPDLTLEEMRSAMAAIEDARCEAECLLSSTMRYTLRMDARIAAPASLASLLEEICGLGEGEAREAAESSPPCHELQMTKTQAFFLRFRLQALGFQAEIVLR